MKKPLSRPAKYLPVLASVAILMAGCAGKIAFNPNDACSIFTEKRGWYGDTLNAREKWGVPSSVIIAFIRQESGFRKRAKQPRRKILWIIPWKRVSSASGYAQAVNKTWEQYLRETKKGGFLTRRSDFKDAADFIGWYNHKSARLLGIKKHDAYNLYLAYHEGWTGYRKGSYKNKEWLIKVARNVDKREKSYRRQLNRCGHKLKRKRFFFF